MSRPPSQQTFKAKRLKTSTTVTYFWDGSWCHRHSYPISPCNGGHDGVVSAGYLHRVAVVFRRRWAVRRRWDRRHRVALLRSLLRQEHARVGRGRHCLCRTRRGKGRGSCGNRGGQAGRGECRTGRWCSPVNNNNSLFVNNHKRSILTI